MLSIQKYRWCVPTVFLIFPALPVASLAADHNLYWDPHHPDSFHVGDRNTPGDGRNYITFSEWKTLPVHKSGYGDRNSQYDDPLLDSNGVSDPQNPCRAGAKPIPGLEVDFFGNPRGDIVDVSAVQVTNVAVNQCNPVRERVPGIISVSVGPRDVRVGMNYLSAESVHYAILDLRGRLIGNGIAPARRDNQEQAMVHLHLPLGSGGYVLEITGAGLPAVTTSFAVP